METTNTRARSMRLFIDCEFNSFKGELISMALVPEYQEIPSFYEVVQWEAPTHPWVEKHVIPELGKDPIPVPLFQRRLEIFLFEFREVHVIADWPEDIMHFCNQMITGPGTRINTPPLTFEILRVDSKSLKPHNALADATGLRKHILEMEIDQSSLAKIVDTLDTK